MHVGCEQNVTLHSSGRASGGAVWQMVALQADRIVRVPLSEATSARKQVDLELYDEVARPFFAS